MAQLATKPISIQSHRLAPEHRTMLRTLCVHSARLGAIDASDPDRWLEEICRGIRTCLDGAVRCTASIFVRTPSSAWRLSRLAHSDGYDPSYTEFIQSRRSTGRTDGLFLGLPEFKELDDAVHTRLRSEMLSDGRWKSSPLYAERERRRLHDFAWACFRPHDVTPARAIVLQLDGSTPAWSPGDTDRIAIETLAMVVREAYASGPDAERRRREALLEKLSPMRRKVAPMLASGMTEAEIAEKLGRSRHTVHEHAKAIYQCWDVTSRHELRDLWLGRTGG